MKRIKRLLLAVLAGLAGLAFAIALFALSSAVVFAGTGADPSDAFRPPELANSSLSASLIWNETTGSAQLGSLEMDRLGLAWADAFALVERRSNGEEVDLSQRFEDSIALQLEASQDTVWLPFEVMQHDITIDLISSNRQVVALTVQVQIDHVRDLTTVRSVDTYEATLANGTAGWTIVTFNRTASLIES